MTRVLLVCDKRDWAYHSIAEALVKYNPEREILLGTYYLKGDQRSFKEVSKDYDLLFFLGWQLIFEKRKGLLSKGTVYRKRFSFIKNNRILTGIHSHHAWDERASTPEENVSPPRALIDSLAKCRGINAVSRRLYSLFKGSGLDKVRYTPNGVDVEIFKPIRPLQRDGRLRVGYSGSLKHDWRKGITEFIEPACAKVGAELKKAMPADGHYVPLKDMPDFYNEIDLYLCASSSEGFSLSVLEASACGRAVISTKISGNEELIRESYNGLFVKRDLSDIIEKLKYLDRDREILREMGRRNRLEIEKKWSWKIRAKDWIEFIKGSYGVA